MLSLIIVYFLCVAFFIPEVRNPREDVPDAGNYSPERAEALTKPKVPTVDMGKSPSRPTSFAKPGSDDLGGPGTYDIPY